MNQLITNQIQEQDINTRKELWDSLFLFVNFQGLKSEYPNMWNKDYRLLPLPGSYQTTREKFTKYCQELNGRLENLINSFNSYFQTNIYPILKSKEGDKTLLFRCDRLLKSKIIGETNSLFPDLLIFELDYLAKQEVKQLLKRLEDIWLFPETKHQELIQADIKKLLTHSSYSGLNIFCQKWTKLITKHQTEPIKNIWEGLKNSLKLWERGKIGKSNWKKQLDIFTEQIEAFFLLGSQSIIDGQPFFQLGKIKQDDERGLVVATQNRKGFSLHNPYLFVINFHQKYFRVYTIENHQHINPRNLYVELTLKEDWIWKDYPSIIHSLGSLESGNHPVYHARNLN